MKKIGHGKVREIYDLEDGTLVIVTTDRISAFDVVMPDPIPNKGKVLNKLSEFWFDYTSNLISNHMITTDCSEMPKYFRKEELMERSMRVKKLKMLPIEAIVRGYITGFGWKSYQKSGSVCGIKLPEGLEESQMLPNPIYTPTTKATEGHDEHISFEDTVKLVGEGLAAQIRDKSIEIYAKCSDYARSSGIIIADTKFEFGVDEDGRLVLADEILTPDSSRFWLADDYEVGRSQKSFDKQYLRDWLDESGWNKEPPAPHIPRRVRRVTAEKYIDAYEYLTGERL